MMIYYIYDITIEVITIAFTDDMMMTADIEGYWYCYSIEDDAW